MGTTDEKTTARTTQAETKPVDFSRRDGSPRGESESFGYQQERDNRENSSQSSIFSPGTTITGGMLDHLIDEYCNQVTTKDGEIQRLEEEIQRLRDEKKRLQSRIVEFKALKEELNRSLQENS